MPEQVPEELSTWVTERVDLLSSLLTRSNGLGIKVAIQNDGH